MTTEPLDLGHGHTLRYTRWAPDRDLNPQYDGIPDVERYGAIIEHTRPDNGRHCVGGLTFDGPVQQALDARPGARKRTTWTVESWEPLTISPSVLCICGDHGFIRDGRWVPA